MAYSKEEMQATGNTHSQVLERLQEVIAEYQSTITRASTVWHQSENAWTPAQITEHVLKANQSFSRILRLFAKTAPEQSPMPENTTPARLQDNGKPQAPTILEPSAGQDWQQLEPLWHETHTKLFAEMSTPSHATDTRTFKHPFLGELTPLQWMQFAVIHTQHHLGQMKEHIVSIRAKK